MKVLIISDLRDKVIKHVRSEAGLSETVQADLNMDLSSDVSSSCVCGLSQSPKTDGSLKCPAIFKAAEHSNLGRQARRVPLVCVERLKNSHFLLHHIPIPLLFTYT